MDESKKNLSNLSLEKSNNSNDYSCGLFNFRPKWLQKLAKKQVFLLIFCLTSVFQGMYFTYIVSILTTLEKLYQLPSRTTGFIISSTEVGQISGSLILTYFGGKGHRPKYIGFGILIFALASILCSLPHFILPNDLERLEFKNLSNQDNLLEGSIITFKQNLKSKLCLKTEKTSGLYKKNFFEKENLVQNECKVTNEQKKKNKITLIATCIFFTASILVGFGTTAVNTLGIPYLDDNVAAKESPLYFAITMGIKIFGPVLGFLLGSLCTNIYVNFPWDNGQGLNPSHPQWIGAWWLGVFLVGVILIFNSIFMMSFPKKLPSSRKLNYNKLEANTVEEKTYQAQESINEKQNESYSELKVEKLTNEKNEDNSNNNNQKSRSEFDCCRQKSDIVKVQTIEKSDLIESDKNSFLSTIKRLLTNKILLCRMVSTVFHILPISGLYTFLPKYLENQYRVTASDASFLSGVAGILVMGFGIFFSGIFMRKFNPSPKFVAKWITIATFLYVCGMILLIFFGCQLPKIAHLNNNQIDDACSNCNCESNQFMPICASNSLTYLSPCMAGCTKLNTTNNQNKYYQCQCLPNNVEILKNGFCDIKCSNLFWYILIFSFIALLQSTTEVGAMLLTLRSVDPKDKTVALGLVTFVASLFGSFPCPIIYGFVIDTACIYWQKDCNTNGACRIFDSEKFRIYFHGLTAFFMFLAFIADLIVWLMSSKISFLEENNEDLNEEKKINDTNNNDSNVIENIKMIDKIESNLKDNTISIINYDDKSHKTSVDKIKNED